MFFRFELLLCAPAQRERYSGRARSAVCAYCVCARVVLLVLIALKTFILKLLLFGTYTFCRFALPH